MKISFEKAKELSIAKWTGIVNDTIPVFNLDKDMRLDLKRHYDCGFCFRHQFEGISESGSKEACSKCEFGKVAGICTEDNSLYSKYTDYDEYEEGALDAAKEILEVIINLKEKEKC